VITLDNESQSAKIGTAQVTDSHLVVQLDDGRQIMSPLDHYPRLLAASAVERQGFEISPFGIHWPALDEDIGLSGMLRDHRSPHAIT
jgi:hypothetical protein